MGERLNSLIAAGKDEVGRILLEEATPALIGEILKGTVIEGATQAAGIAVPGIGNIMISYRQKKLERNFEIYVSKIVEKQDEINARLSLLEEKKRKEIGSKYFGLIADYASQSKQEEKIDLMVNGFINLAGGVLCQEDVVLMYYDTLEQLSMLDIRVLRLYVHSIYMGQDYDDDLHKISEDYDLDYSQVDMIKEKLTRLGLLESRNDADMDENIRNMSQYLEDVRKGKKNAKLNRLKRISKSESYRITTYGNRLFDFFTEVSDTEK